MENDLPPIQGFADRVSEEDQYWHAFGSDDGPDGFGTSQELAHMLCHGAARACFEAESTSDLWDSIIPESNDACARMDQLPPMEWPSSSQTSPPELSHSATALALSSAPICPALDIDMDIDSGSDDEADM